MIKLISRFIWCVSHRRAVWFLFAMALPTMAAAQDVTATAGRGPADTFGAKGQLAISSDAALVIQHASNDVTSIQLAPAVDWFVINGLSLGGFISFDYSKAGNDSGSRFGIGPRVGYNIALTDFMSVWPKIGFSYAHSSAKYVSAFGDGTSLVRNKSADALALNVFVPVMFHPATHFFVGFGPFLDTDLNGDNKVTVYGLKMTLGGWL